MKFFTLFTSCLLLVILFSRTTTAEVNFNITQVLSKFGYNTFNHLLSETKLAEEINSRHQTITVLAVQDGSASSLSGKPLDVTKRILSTHILLDFYDMKKLKNLNGSAEITTFFQSSGIASGQQGFLKVANTGNGQMKVGSAVNNANLDVSINKLVMNQGYDLAVLDVSGIINVPGLEHLHVAPAHSPRKMLAPPPAAEGPSAEGPGAAPGPKTESSSPSKSPESSGAPTGAEDMEDSENSDAPSPSTSGAFQNTVGFEYITSLTVFLVALFFAAL